jgi:hypothetical protein
MRMRVRFSERIRRTIVFVEVGFPLHQLLLDVPLFLLLNAYIENCTKLYCWAASTVVLFGCTIPVL